MTVRAETAKILLLFCWEVLCDAFLLRIFDPLNDAWIVSQRRIHPKNLVSWPKSIFSDSSNLQKWTLLAFYKFLVLRFQGPLLSSTALLLRFFWSLCLLTGLLRSHFGEHFFTAPKATFSVPQLFELMKVPQSLFFGVSFWFCILSNKCIKRKI